MIEQATLVTCVFQVTGIAAATLLLSCCMRRIAGHCRLNLPLTGLLLVLAFTLLTPVPWTKWCPTWAIAKPSHLTASEPAKAGSDHQVPSYEFAAADVLRLSRSLISQMSDWLRTQPTLRRSDYSGWLIGIWSLGCAVGFLRLWLGWRRTQQLLRRGLPVHDRRVVDLCESLATEMRISSKIDLLELVGLSDAATWGNSPAVVVLPGEWRTWNEDELRAVLAHELAHVARSDFRTRLVAHAIAALHGYHPLIRMLVSQLTLQQELAADVIAAQYAGGPRPYARLLAQLALRMDSLHGFSRQEYIPIAAIVPVFSSSLLRRVRMLRVMDDSRTTPNKAWMAVAIAGLVGLSLGMLTLTSLAEPPQQPTESPKVPAAANDQQEPVARLANRPDAPARPRNEHAKELFHHDPLDAPQIESNANGSIHLRLAELFRRKDLAVLRAIADQQFQKEWAQMLPGMPALDLRIDDIEAVTCDLKVVVRVLNETAERVPDKKNGSLSVGASGVVVRLSKRLNWRELFDNLPRLVKRDFEGRPGFEIPAIPDLGPQRPFLVFLDDSTVLISFGDGFLKQWLKNEVVRSHSHERDTAWKAVDGGLLTMVHDCEPAIWNKMSPAVLEEQERVWLEVMKRVSRISLGMDWLPTTNEMGVRCRLETSSPADAASVQNALAQWSSASRTTPATIEAPILEKLRSLIADIRIDDSTVIISGEFPLTTTDFMPAQIATRP